MSIIGIVLGTIAIGLFIWLKNDQKMTNSLHEGDLIAAKHAFEALMDDFNNYQIDNERKMTKLEKEIEIKSKQNERANEKLIDELPVRIRKVIGHIEFAKPLDR
jgi:hypothetical protein